MDKQTYKTGQLQHILGLSRDALRYYEEKGIISPRQNEENNYREYDFRDIYTLMVTDFYKKRNLTISDVKKLQTGSEISELEGLLEKKAAELKERILLESYMLERIEETKEFCKEIQNNLNKYSIRKMPTFKVLGEITDFDAMDEYNMVLKYVDLLKDDILSKLMRKFTFDDTGYKDCKMFIAEKSDDCSSTVSQSFINYTSCMYTIVEDRQGKHGEEDTRVRALWEGAEWARENGLQTEGVVYLRTRLITYSENTEKIYHEVFVPIK